MSVSYSTILAESVDVRQRPLIFPIAESILNSILFAVRYKNSLQILVNRAKSRTLLETRLSIRSLI